MSNSTIPTTTPNTAITTNTTPTTVTNTTEHTQTKPSPLIKAALINASSIRNKCHFVVEFFNDKNLDILFITETWLKLDDIPLIGLLTSGLLYFRHIPRPSVHFGGDIGILFKLHLKLTSLTDLSLNHSESASFSFHTQSTRPFTAILTYRPPAQSITLFLDEFQILITNSTPSTIFIGEYNIPFNKTNSYSLIVHNIIKSANFHQHINHSTHITGNILDLVISHNDTHLVSNL